MKNWLLVRNLAPASGSSARIGEIQVRGYIGESNVPYRDYYDGTVRESDGAGTMKELLAAVEALGNVDEIVLRVTSEGGDVFTALVLADVLNNHRAKITGIIEGYAFSAATVLLAKCADEIQMPANSWQMIHCTETFVDGDANELRARADLLDQMSNNIAEIYASRGGGTAASFRALMDSNSYLLGSECRDLKLADVITDEVVLSNCAKPDASLFRNAALGKMPEPLRALFDTRAPSATSTDSNLTTEDMKPEEIQNLITNAVRPLEEKNTALEGSLAAARGEITNAIEAAVAPVRVENAALRADVTKLTTENTKLETDLVELRNLHASGVVAAAQGAPPITNAGEVPPTEPATPRARMIGAFQNASVFAKK